MILTLPAPLTVYDIDWLSIWSKRIGRSLAHVDVHRKALNVPPALEDLVNPKSELNCETLDASLGLQLRWSLTDESSADPAVLLQLVANTGSDRYLAIGIRSEEGSRGIAGDVIVGWIKARSGKGGVDDYFLASDHERCPDDAESCPDTSQPGGRKNVELLNSVSRANYTMLTFRRSVRPSDDAFDVPVLLDRPQNIFWSVGFKNPAVRKRRKPVKNKAPMEIDFGRSPRWNCHDDGLDAASESSATKRQPTKSTLSPQYNWIDDRDAHFSDYDGDEDISQQHPSTVAPLAEGNFYSEGVQYSTVKPFETSQFSTAKPPRHYGGGGDYHHSKTINFHPTPSSFQVGLKRRIAIDSSM